jgi:putative ABC transport system substrate-binding protein
MDRRTFLCGLTLGALAIPLTSEAQPTGKVPQIGFLTAGSLSATLPLWNVFKERLRELGYLEGQNITFETRGADGRTEGLPGLATELVNLKVDVIVTSGTPAAVAAKHATSTIPIVTAIVADPVGAGLISSFAHPGGNITGIADLDEELSGKRLALLRDIVPGLSRVALVWNTNNPAHKIAMRQAQVAAKALSVQLVPVDVRSPSELKSAFSALTKERAGGLLLAADSMFFTYRAQVVEYAGRSRLPAVFWRKDFVEAGGLMSYGTSYPDLYRGAAAYVDKILKGAKAATLPVEQPTKFELVINLKTAKALGLTIPQSLLLRADEVIQ